MAETANALTVENLRSVTGSVNASPDCGFILNGSARVNDITVPEGMDACAVIFTEDGNYTVSAIE